MPPASPRITFFFAIWTLPRKQNLLERPHLGKEVCNPRRGHLLHLFFAKDLSKDLTRLPCNVLEKGRVGRHDPIALRRFKKVEDPPSPARVFQEQPRRQSNQGFVRSAQMRRWDWGLQGFLRCAGVEIRPYHHRPNISIPWRRAQGTLLDRNKLRVNLGSGCTSETGYLERSCKSLLYRPEQARTAGGIRKKSPVVQEKPPFGSCFFQRARIPASRRRLTLAPGMAKPPVRETKGTSHGRQLHARQWREGT